MKKMLMTETQGESEKVAELFKEVSECLDKGGGGKTSLPRAIRMIRTHSPIFWRTGWTFPAGLSSMSIGTLAAVKRFGTSTSLAIAVNMP